MSELTVTGAFKLPLRSRILYAFLRIAKPILTLLYGYSCRPYKPKSKTYLMLSNHVTDMDPFFQGLMLPDYMRFVATEKLVRSKPFGPIVRFLVDPIPRKKAASADSAIAMIKDTLASGVSVAMQAEGIRSINGRTGKISPRTGQLVKECTGGLVTCRLTGGYMTHPLWAVHRRKGRIRGEVVAEYTREQLDAMSVDEVNAIINRDLYTDAYEEQRADPVAYRCKAPAEGLENALYVCPVCHEIGTMKGVGRRFDCRCGAGVELDDYGFFHGGAYETVADWDDWQRSWLREQALAWKNTPEAVLVSQSGLRFKDLNAPESEPEETEISLTATGLTVGKRFFPVESITKMSNHRSTTVLFSTDDGYYELSGAGEWPVFSFIIIYRALRGKL